MIGRTRIEKGGRGRRSLVLALVLALAGCGTTAPPPQAALSPAAAATSAAAPSIDQAAILARLVPSRALDAAARPVTTPFVPGLALVCVIDRPPGQRLLGEADLPALGLTRANAIALARANLRAGLQPLAPLTAKLPVAGEIATIRGDFAEAGRLLLHDQWAGLAAALGGSLLVAAPADDVILYSGGSAPALAAAAARIAATAPHPVSAAVLRWTRQGWDVVIPSAATPSPHP